MGKILKIGKALYEVDDRTKTYWFYGRNFERVSQEEEQQNKRKIDGFIRIFRDGRKQRYKFKI